MKKIAIGTLILILSLVPMFALAEKDVTFDVEVDDIPVVKVVQINNDIEVEILEDGRIKPIANVEHLSNDELDRILVHANFSEEELELYPLEFKKRVAESGGMKVDSEVTLVQRYHSLDGNVYEVNEETREKVNEIKKRDLMTLIEMNDDDGFKLLNAESCSINIDTCYQEDGIWQSLSVILSSGKRGNDYYYQAFKITDWSRGPLAQYTDRWAIAADSFHRAAAERGGRHYSIRYGISDEASQKVHPHGAEWWTPLYPTEQSMDGYQYYYIDCRKTSSKPISILGKMRFLV